MKFIAFILLLAPLSSQAMSKSEFLKNVLSGKDMQSQFRGPPGITEEIKNQIFAVYKKQFPIFKEEMMYAKYAIDSSGRYHVLSFDFDVKKCFYTFIDLKSMGNSVVSGKDVKQIKADSSGSIIDENKAEIEAKYCEKAYSFYINGEKK